MIFLLFIINYDKSPTGNAVLEDDCEIESCELGFDSLTADEVAKHNLESDCWIIVNEKVYDMTDFLATSKHKPIDSLCGTDATNALGKSPHGDSKVGMLELIGDLQ